MIGPMRGLPLVLRDLAMAGSRDAEGAFTAQGEDEFRAFYERTSRPLWAYLSRICGDPHRADDFLQEAYYRFYRAGTRYESEAHRRNSLFQIATHVARDANRRRRGREEVPLDEEGPGALPETVAATQDRHAATRIDLNRAMQQLEPVQRELLWLAYAQGASHEEIAGILGVRTISVRTLLLRAKRKAAAILAGASRTASQEAES